MYLRVRLCTSLLMWHRPWVSFENPILACYSALDNIHNVFGTSGVGNPVHVLCWPEPVEAECQAICRWFTTPGAKPFWSSHRVRIGGTLPRGRSYEYLRTLRLRLCVIMPFISAFACRFGPGRRPWTLPAFLPFTATCHNFWVHSM
jgi:hypothetical protein